MESLVFTSSFTQPQSEGRSGHVFLQDGGMEYGTEDGMVQTPGCLKLRGI